MQDPLREAGFFLSEFLSRQTKGALSSCLIFVAEAAGPRQGTALARVPQVNLVRAGRPLLPAALPSLQKSDQNFPSSPARALGQLHHKRRSCGFPETGLRASIPFLKKWPARVLQAFLPRWSLSTAGTSKEGDCFLYTPRCEQTSLLCNCIHFPQTAKAGEAGEQQPGRQLPSTGEERTLEETTCSV